jgi:choline dehydrogenase-like flavoprotein
MAHPILQSLPFDMRTALTFFRQLRSALGVINMNFHDTRRAASFVTLDRRDGGSPSLVVEYVSDAGEAAHVKQALGRLRKAMVQLRCIVPPGLTHVRPKGASVHYAGTFPAQSSGHSLTTTPDCRSTDFENLFFVDGSTFPFLPAKNITFSLMANAVRVAAAAF